VVRDAHGLGFFGAGACEDGARGERGGGEGGAGERGGDGGRAREAGGGMVGRGVRGEGGWGGLGAGGRVRWGDTGRQREACGRGGSAGDWGMWPAVAQVRWTLVGRGGVGGGISRVLGAKAQRVGGTVRSARRHWFGGGEGFSGGPGGG